MMHLLPSPGNIAPTVEHTPEERGVIGSNPIVPIGLLPDLKNTQD